LVVDESKTMNGAGVTVERVHFDALLPVPDLDRAVGAGRGDEFAVRTDSHGLDGPGVLRLQRNLAARQLPNAHAPVPRRGQDVVPVATERHGGNPILVAAEALCLLAGAALELPELDGHVSAAAYQVLAVLAERDGGKRPAMSREGDRLAG